MADLDLKALWQEGNELEKSLPSVAQSARERNNLSLHLVERIKKTARTEHRIFLAAATLGIVLLGLFGYPYWAVGVLFFTFLVIWKYELEMRVFNRIQAENSLLEYLLAVNQLLKKFVRNYRIGIAVAVPLAAVVGVFFGQWLAQGHIDWSGWLKPMVWLVLLGSIIVGILLARLWLNFWVTTLYGKKLKEMERMIQDLQEDA